MTSSEIVRLPFDKNEVGVWARSGDKRITNWPVVYILDDDTTKPNANRPSKRSSEPNRRKIYVGESLNVAARMRQHFASIERSTLTNLRVILDETFNKSVCLDLESYLIEMLSGDGAFEVLNRNDGIVNADYYNRAAYLGQFDAIFNRLKLDGVFTRTIPEIINSDLFKLSPFKSLTDDQAFAVEGVVKRLFDDLRSKDRSTTVIQGDPGTGKTVVAIYLLKLLADIRASTPLDALDDDRDSLFSEFFTDEHRMLLREPRIGFVIPQQSLRKSVQKVFRKTPGLDPSMVLTAFDVGESEQHFDLLIVDETHRLNQRANQPAAALLILWRTPVDTLTLVCRPAEATSFAAVGIAEFGFRNQRESCPGRRAPTTVLTSFGSEQIRPIPSPAERREGGAFVATTRRYRRDRSRSGGRCVRARWQRIGMPTITR